jgi:hypothetical protein
MVCQRTGRESLGILLLLVHHSSELLRVFSQLSSIAFKFVEFSSPLLSEWYDSLDLRIDHPRQWQPIVR